LFTLFKQKKGQNDLGEMQTPFLKMRAGFLVLRGFLDRREGIRIKGFDERV